MRTMQDTAMSRYISQPAPIASRYTAAPSGIRGPTVPLSGCGSCSGLGADLTGYDSMVFPAVGAVVGFLFTKSILVALLGAVGGYLISRNNAAAAATAPAASATEFTAPVMDL